ncbi:MAG: O-antigen ligase family protein [Fibrobacteres bacterium]|jgi:O-antigen ligase|nr:O-antigen ligase family protein [Fibrobacterota bacterium]
MGFCYLLGTFLALNTVAYATGLFLWNDIFQPLTFAKDYGAYPVAYYVLGVLILSYGINLARGNFRPIFGPYFLAAGALLGWILVCTAMSPFQVVAWPEFVRYLKYLLPLMLMFTAINKPRDVLLIAGALCASVAPWAAEAGLHCLIHGVNIDLGIGGGQMAERNDFTAAIVGTLPVLLYFARNYDYKLKIPVRAVLWLFFLLSLSTIFYSLSRGASIGLALMSLSYVLFISRRKFRDTGFLILIGLVVYLILPAAWFERMGTINLGVDQKEASAASRMNLMTGALHASLDRPVFGWGPDGWLEVAFSYTNDTHNPHNIYLKLSSEVGVPGLILYLVLIGVTFTRTIKAVNLANRMGDKRMAGLGLSFVTGILGLLSAMSFLNAPFNEYLMAWVMLANAFAGVYPASVARQRGQTKRKAGKAGRAPRPDAGPQAALGNA